MINLSDLRKYELIYVGTPYTKYPAGIEEAFRDACSITADLLRSGLRVYSPIAHTHPIAIYGNIDPLDYEIWLPFDAAIMKASDAMIVVKMETWEKSHGVKHEIETFTAAGKPVFYLDPWSMEISNEGA